MLISFIIDNYKYGLESNNILSYNVPSGSLYWYWCFTILVCQFQTATRPLLCNTLYESTYQRNFFKMNRIAYTSFCWGVSTAFSLMSPQSRLTYEQRLRLKADGRPCPKVTVKNSFSASVYENFSWICGDEEKNTYFCWPCFLMGVLSKINDLILITEKIVHFSHFNHLWYRFPLVTRFLKFFLF